ncbi:MAG: type II secretion system F family protein [Chloroflexi bacterium]|nr:type II secretion system F family protein [Chloroflexota bacterium]
MNRSQTSRPRTSLARNKKKGARTRNARARGKSTGVFGMFRRDSAPKIKRAIVIAFARELATLIESGIPVVQALVLTGEQRRGTPLEPVVRRMVRDLNSGMLLADAMAVHSSVFSHIFIQTVATSDRGAPVAEVLRQAADFLDTADSAIAQAKQALIYPAIVMTVGLVVVTLLITVVLPSMTQLLVNLDQGLPLPTKILIWLSDFLITQKLPLLVGGLIVTVGTAKYIKTPRGKLQLHKLVLRVPAASTLIVYSDIARASAAMSALTSAGLSLPEAVEVATGTASNLVIRGALARGRAGLLAGDGLARPLAATGVFPETFIQTLRVAEDTGTMDANLKRMADFYQKEAESAVKNLVGLVEPLSTVFIALIVGFIAMAVVMPMYSALGSLGN